MSEEKKQEDNIQNDNQTEAVVDVQKDEQKTEKENNSEDKKEENTESSSNSSDGKKTETEDKKPETEKKDFKKNFRKRSPAGRRKPFKREPPEFEQKIVSLRRVTRVMAGGRRFSFSCGIVLGDKKGSVGFGMGKASDTAAAIEKAIRQAKKTMVTLSLSPEDNSISYEVSAKYKASEVVIRPVKGKGLAAGGAVRIVLDLAGVDETGAKILTRSKNNINNVKATLKALLPFSKPKVHKKSLTSSKKNFSPRNGKSFKRNFEQKEVKKEIKD